MPEQDLASSLGEVKVTVTLGPSAGSREQGAGSRVQGGRNKEYGARNKEQGARSKEQFLAAV